jgi:flagellar biosynthesis protein FliO
MKSMGETIEMDLAQPKLARREIVPTNDGNIAPRFFALATDRLKALWRMVVAHTGSKGKTLTVRESAALGDRRFVSVIQFEHQRFLIGSSPAAVSLLAQLPDQPQSCKESGEESRKESNAEKRGEKN